MSDQKLHGSNRHQCLGEFFFSRRAVFCSRMCSGMGRNVQFLPRDATQWIMPQYVVHPSVYLSVTFRYADHTSWNRPTSKIITRLD